MSENSQAPSPNEDAGINPASLPPAETASQDELPRPRQSAREPQSMPESLPPAEVSSSPLLPGAESALMGDDSHSGIDRVMEIPLTIHVELGRKRMRIRELLQVGAGAVFTLDTQAGASLSIYANKTLIAEGEAVVVGERYGVRVTDIVSPAERVRRLGGDEQ